MSESAPRFRRASIVDELLAELAEPLKGRGERLRDGVRIVIAGPPNAGKSSLLNALAKRDVAIVAEEAGTTRDVIEVHLDLGGLPVILTDTAGLRETEGKVEAEGVRRALARAGEADVVIWLVDAAAPVWQPPDSLRTGSDALRRCPEQDRPRARRQRVGRLHRDLGQDRAGD